MYIPSYYKENDRNKIISFIKENSFGVIVTPAEELHATHLPFLIEENGEDLILLSHLSAANPHANVIAGNNSLVIFTGPNGYISPSFYDNPVSVPTWNYIAVHASGKPELITGREENLILMEKTINAFESEYMKQWNNLPQDFVSRMIEGIVSFRIKVEKLEGKFKMSQNKSSEERNRMVHEFSKGNEASKALAAEIQKNIK